MDARKIIGLTALFAAMLAVQRYAQAAVNDQPAAIGYDPDTGLYYDAEGYLPADYTPPALTTTANVAQEETGSAPAASSPAFTWDAFAPYGDTMPIAPAPEPAPPGTANLDTQREATAPGFVASTIASAFGPSTAFDIEANPNVRAFLDMIGYSEGADYSTLYGGGTFDSYADHPRRIITAGGWSSSAAGKYQILRKTWDDVAPKIGATDFSPYWQDRAAVFLIKRRGALADVIAGRFQAAIAKVRKEWASLPGAGYGQPERKLSQLRDVYLAAGGQIETV